MASSNILKVCKGKRSFQLYQDQSDRVNEAYNIGEYLRNLSEKFPLTTFGCSMGRIALLNVAFLVILELEENPVEGQSLQQKDKRRKRKDEINLKKTEKPREISHFLM